MRFRPPGERARRRWGQDAGATVVRRSPALAAGLGWLAASAASAQVAPAPDLFARDRAVGVRERLHPGYEAAGLRVGGLTLSPRITVGTEVTDNVFASERQPEADMSWQVQPELLLKTEVPRRGAQVLAQGGLSRNVRFHSEDFQDWRLAADGWMAATSALRLAAGAQASHQVEARTASGAAPSERPIRFGRVEARIEAVRTTGRLRLSARGEARRFDYADGRDAGGSVLSQAGRDRTQTVLTTRVDYALSPAVAVFAQVVDDRRRYPNPWGDAPDRSSHGGEVLAGVDFQLGGLSRGEAAAGYIRQTFDHAAYADLSGFAGRVKLDWFPTQLTTVSAAASRSIEDTGVPGAAGALRTTAGLSVDHELLRNLLLTGQAAYGRDAYDGLDRRDQRFSLTLAATWRVNRRLSISGALARIDQTSSGAGRGPEYDATRVTVSAARMF